jgi:predicted aspartyl protease
MRHFKAFAVLAISGGALGTLGHAQGIPNTTHADPRADPHTDTTRADTSARTIPFTARNGFILIAGTVDRVHGTFMLDTGSPDFLLNSSRIEATNVTSSGQAVGGAQGEMVEIGSVGEVHAGPLVAHQVVANFLNLQRLEDQLGGVPILGVLGVGQLRPYEVIVDWPRHVLALLPLDSAGKRISSVQTYVPVRRIPLREGESHHFYATVTFRGTALQLLVDTGSPVNFIETSVWNALPGVKTGSGIPEGRPDTTVTDSLTIGALTYPNVTFRINRLIPLDDDVQMQGYLGQPFFERNGTLGYNFRTKELLLFK